jgi:hypothetical protein
MYDMIVLSSICVGVRVKLPLDEEYHTLLTLPDNESGDRSAWQRRYQMQIRGALRSLQGCGV